MTYTYADFPVGARVSVTRNGSTVTGRIRGMWGHGGAYKVTTEGEWLTLRASVCDGINVDTDVPVYGPTGRPYVKLRTSPANVTVL